MGFPFLRGPVPPLEPDPVPELALRIDNLSRPWLPACRAIEESIPPSLRLSAADWTSIFARRNRDVPIGAKDSTGRLMGYAVYRLRPHTVELRALAVSPGYRRLGVGTALNDRVLEQLSYSNETFHGRYLALAAVPDLTECLPAHLFLKGCGWEATGIDPAAGVIRFGWFLEAEAEGKGD